MLRQRMRWFFLESADSWYQMFGFLTFDPEPTVEALETRCAHLSQRLEAASAWHFFVFIRGLKYEAYSMSSMQCRCSCFNFSISGSLSNVEFVCHRELNKIFATKKRPSCQLCNSLLQSVHCKIANEIIPAVRLAAIMSFHCYLYRHLQAV